jgi:DNA (cytosine-5)-methyltransferase 1
MLRAIREIQPSWVVGENVRGLTNWNGGLVFDEVQTELEAQGYEVLPFLLPACAVNAPHRRDRIWFIAYSNGAMLRANKLRSIRRENEKITTEGSQTIYNAFRPNGIKGNATDTNGIRLWGQSDGIGITDEFSKTSEEQNVTDTKQFRLEHSQKRGNFTESQRQTQRERCSITKQFKANGWTGFPTVSPICGGVDGLPKELDNITFSKWRKESLKAYGNAVVPQVAYQIFKSICQYQEL